MFWKIGEVLFPIDNCLILLREENSIGWNIFNYQFSIKCEIEKPFSFVLSVQSHACCRGESSEGARRTGSVFCVGKRRFGSGGVLRLWCARTIFKMLDIYTHKTVKCYLNKGQMQSADKGLCVERELKEGAALFSLSLFRQCVCSATSSLSRAYMDFQSISDSRALVTKSAALAFPAAAARGRTLHIAFCQKPDAPPSALCTAFAIKWHPRCHF